MSQPNDPNKPSFLKQIKGGASLKKTPKNKQAKQKDDDSLATAIENRMRFIRDRTGSVSSSGSNDSWGSSSKSSPKTAKQNLATSTSPKSQKQNLATSTSSSDRTSSGSSYDRTSSAQGKINAPPSPGSNENQAKSPSTSPKALNTKSAAEVLKPAVPPRPKNTGGSAAYDNLSVPRGINLAEKAQISELVYKDFVAALNDISNPQHLQNLMRNIEKFKQRGGNMDDVRDKINLALEQFWPAGSTNTDPNTFFGGYVFDQFRLTRNGETNSEITVFFNSLRDRLTDDSMSSKNIGSLKEVAEDLLYPKKRLDR